MTTRERVREALRVNCKTLAHEDRLDLFTLVVDQGEMTFNEIREARSLLSNAQIASHLAWLIRAGLLDKADPNPESLGAASFSVSERGNKVYSSAT